MKRLISILCFLITVIYAGGVKATERFAIAVEGAYLLVQDDQHQRVLTLERGGNVTQVSDQQTVIGFSVGQGEWEETGPDRVTARVIDFSFDPKGGHRLGPTLIIYELNFAEMTSGKYQRVSGSLSGKLYPVGENPLHSTKPAVQSFGIGFKGQRITFK